MKTPLKVCGASRPGESLYTRGEMARRANRLRLIPLLAVVGLTALGAWQALAPTPDLRGGPRRVDIPANEGVLAIGYLLEEAGEHRSEEHTSELQSLRHLVCRLLLEKKKTNKSELDRNAE